MNYVRFQQVAGDFEKGCFQEWCRNREFAPMEELFEDWWNLSFTARELKRTEKEYEYYSTAKRPTVAQRYSGIGERPSMAEELISDLARVGFQSRSTGVASCPSCGKRLRLEVYGQPEE